MQASYALLLHPPPLHLILLPLVHLFEDEVAGEDEGAREGEGECESATLEEAYDRQEQPLRCIISEAPG